MCRAAHLDTTVMLALFVLLGALTSQLVRAQPLTSLTLSDASNRRGLTIATNETNGNFSLCRVSAPTAPLACAFAGLSSSYAMTLPYFRGGPESLASLPTFPEEIACTSEESSLDECVYFLPNPEFSQEPCTEAARSGLLCPESRSSTAPQTPTNINLFVVYADLTEGGDCHVSSFFETRLAAFATNFWDLADPNGSLQNIVFRQEDYSQESENKWCAYTFYAVNATLSSLDLDYFFVSMLTSSENRQALQLLDQWTVSYDVPLATFDNTPNPPWGLVTEAPPQTSAPGGGGNVSNSSFPPLPPAPTSVGTLANTTGWHFRLADVASGEPNAVAGMLLVLPPDSDTWGTVCRDNVNREALVAICGSLGIDAKTPAFLPIRGHSPALGLVYLSHISCMPEDPNVTRTTMRTLENNCTWLFSPYGSSTCSRASDVVVSCASTESDYPPRLITAVVAEKDFDAQTFQQNVAAVVGVMPMAVNITSNSSGGLGFMYVSFEFVDINMSGFPGGLPPGGLPPGDMTAPPGMTFPPGGSPPGDMTAPPGMTFPPGGLPGMGSGGEIPPDPSNGMAGSSALMGYPATAVAALMMAVDPARLFVGASIYELRDNVTLPNGPISTSQTAWTATLTPPPFSLPASATNRVGRVTIQPGPNAAFGTLCSYGTDSQIFTQMCVMMQLGSTGRMIPHFSPGSGPIYLSNVTCFPSLPSCAGFLFSTADNKTNVCTHASDAGVMCGTGVGPVIEGDTVNVTFTVSMDGYDGDPVNTATCVAHMANVPSSRFVYLDVGTTPNPDGTILLNYELSGSTTSGDLTVGDILLILNVTLPSVFAYECSVIQMTATAEDAVIWTSTAAPPTTAIPPPPPTITTLAPTAAPMATPAPTPDLGSTTTEGPATSSQQTSTQTAVVTSTADAVTSSTPGPTVTSSSAPQTTTPAATATQALVTSFAPQTASTGAPVATVLTSSLTPQESTATPNSTLPDSNSTSTNVTASLPPTTQPPTLPPATAVVFSFANASMMNASALLDTLARVLNISKATISIGVTTNTTVSVVFQEPSLVNQSVALANNNTFASLGVTGGAAIIPTWPPTTSTLALSTTATPSNTTALPSSGDDKASNVGMIIGIVAGAVVLVAVVAAVVVKSKANAKGTGQPAQSSLPTNEYEERLNGSEELFDVQLYEMNERPILL